MTIGIVSLMVLSRKRAISFTTRSIGLRASCRAVETRNFSTFHAIHEAHLVQDMIHRIRSINQMPDDVRASVIDFTVDGVKLGKVNRQSSVLSVRNFCILEHQLLQ